MAHDKFAYKTKFAPESRARMWMEKPSKILYRWKKQWPQSQATSKYLYLCNILHLSMYFNVCERGSLVFSHDNLISSSWFQALSSSLQQIFTSTTKASSFLCFFTNHLRINNKYELSCDHFNFIFTWVIWEEETFPKPRIIPPQVEHLKISANRRKFF